MGTNVMIDYPAGQRRMAGKLFEGYRNLVLAQQPVAYWPLDELTGSTAFDVSGHGNNGQIIGGVTLGEPGPIAGNADDTAYAFNGSSAEVSIPSVLTPSNLSVMVWVQTSASAEPSNAGLIGWHSWVDIIINTNGQPRFEVGTGGDTLSAGPSVFDGIWHQLAMTFNAATLLVTGYMDGVAVGNYVTNGLPSLGIEGTIGSWVGGYFSGNIAQVVAWRQILSPSTIQHLYRAGKTAFDLLDGQGNWYTDHTAEGSYPAQVLALQPTAYWRLNDPAGTIAHDSAGHPPNDGTIQGGVTLNQPGPFGTMGDVAMGFNGSNSYIQLPATTCIQGPLTWLAWVNPRSWVLDSGADSATFVVSADPGVRLMVTDLGYIEGSIQINGVWQNNLVGSIQVPLNEPSLCAVSVDGTTFSVYVNGQLAGSETISSGTITYDLSTPYVIGADNYSGTPYHEFFDGMVGEVALFPYALSGAQVSQLYQAAKGTYAFGPTASGGQRGPLYVPQLVEASSYTNTVLADHPVWYAPLQDPAGTVVRDLAGRPAKNGTIHGGVTLNQPGPFNKMGDVAMGFNGSTGYIQTSYDPVVVSISLALWFNTVNLNPQALLDNRGGGTAFLLGINANSWIGLGTSTPGSLTVGINGPSIWNSLQSAQSYADGNWHFVVGTMQAYVGEALGYQLMALYVDGVLLSNADEFNNNSNAISPIQGGVGYQIAQNGTDTGPAFEGLMAQLAIYDYALSPTQVNQHYQAGLGQFLVS